jgi:hypothetical protein
MDLDDAGCRARYLIRDRDGKFPALMDEILAEAGIKTVISGIRMPRMNSIMERWVQSCRRELLDRCLLWNERHLWHALREYERFYNQHRAHQALNQAAPLRPVPDPITDPGRITGLNIRRRDRLGGVLQRVLTCRLNCTDGIFGRHSPGSPVHPGRQRHRARPGLVSLPPPPPNPGPDQPLPPTRRPKTQRSLNAIPGPACSPNRSPSDQPATTSSIHVLCVADSRARLFFRISRIHKKTRTDSRAP